MGLERAHRLMQRFDRRHFPGTIGPLGRRAHAHENRKCRSTIVQIGAAIPVFQDLLRLGEIRVAARFDLLNLFNHARQVRMDAIGKVKFIAAKLLGADRCIRAECFERPHGTVRHVGLDAECRREIRSLEVVLGRGGLKRRVVGIEDETGLWIPDLRYPVERQIAVPDQVGAIARQHALPIHSFLPDGKFGVIDIADVSALIGVDVVDARKSLQAHRVLPLGKISRLVQPIVLQRLAYLAHSGITQGEHAVIGLQHGAVRGIKNLAVKRPDQRSEELYANGCIAALKGAPFSVEQVLIGVLRIEGKPVDVDEVRIVDGRSPAEMLVMTVKHEGRAGKKPAGDVPAFFAPKNRLIPGNRAYIRLMRIDQKSRRAVARPRRGNGHAVRSDFGKRFAPGARGEPSEHRVEAVEEGCLEDEASGDVLAGQRQQARLNLFGVQHGKIIHPIRIGLEHGAKITRQRRVFRIDRFPDAHQMHDVVAGRGSDAVCGGELAARCQSSKLDGLEVVFGVGKAYSKRHVGVGFAKDVRNAVAVARDAHIIEARARNHLRLLGLRWPAKALFNLRCDETGHDDRNQRCRQPT